MARRKNMENETILLEALTDSGLLSRIEKISEQTGLSTLDLVQKWVLQEESLIGLMARGKNNVTEQAETTSATSSQRVPGVQKQENPAEIDFNSPDYRKMLIERAKKLKKEGITLVKIAEIFNEEKVQTVSGKGKWYSSSIVNLLNSTV
jgi:hypothetical protein